MIGAYANTEEKKKILFDLVKFLKSQNKTILISSHLLVDQYILNLVDYFVYDKENKLITDKKYFGWVFYSDPDICVFSKNCSKHNTCLAVVKLICGGLSIAKAFNFDILHYIEYDTELKSIEEINNNEKILAEGSHGAVIYTQDDGCMLGNYFCFNVNQVNKELYSYDESSILKDLLEFGICEEIISKKMLPNQKFLKPESLIRNESFKTQLVANEFLYWGLVIKVCEAYYCFCYNHLDKPQPFNVIVDNKSYNFWLLPKEKNLIPLQENPRYIKIFGDNILHKDYDLQNPEDVKEITDYNHIKSFNR